MTLAFRAYDASRCDYPRSRIPVVPPLEARLFGYPARLGEPTSFDASDRVVFARGRYALLHALRASGLSSEHSVLIPAYHCRTMVDPVVRFGAVACFYPLAADLSPDLVRLGAVAKAATRRVKALLLPHYFGYAQDVKPVAEFCAERGIVLIEDCCHAYFGSAHGHTLGSIGDFAIASPSKFFPCEDGGVLIMRGTRLPPTPPRRRAIADEVRSVYRVAEEAWSNLTRRSGTAQLRELTEKFDSIRRQYPRWDAEVTSGPALSHQYRLQMEPLGALSMSRWVIRSSNVARICERRRRNYVTLLDGVRSLPRCRPLYSDLPEGTVPYMFPLLIDQPEHRFHWLKHLGVPMYRWDELATSECAVSNHYRLHLVHLPCHQGLRDDDLSWLLRALSLVLTAEVDPDTRARQPRLAEHGPEGHRGSPQ